MQQRRIRLKRNATEEAALQNGYIARIRQYETMMNANQQRMVYRQLVNEFRNYYPGVNVSIDPNDYYQSVSLRPPSIPPQPRDPNAPPPVPELRPTDSISNYPGQGLGPALWCDRAKWQGPNEEYYGVRQRRASKNKHSHKKRRGVSNKKR